MSTISSGTTLTTALVQTGDTTGNLVIKTGSSNTTAMTISGSDQSVTIAGTLTANGSSITPSQWTSNSTAIYYNTGNVGIGTSSPATILNLAANNTGAENNTLRLTDTATNTTANQQIGKIEFYSSDTSSPGAGVKSYIGSFANDGTPEAYLAFATADGSAQATERMRLDSSGNLGLGVTPSAWRTGVGLTAVQISGGSLWSYASSEVNVAQNYYYGAAGTRYYLTTAAASGYYQGGGQHVWQTAPSGTAGATCTLTDRMTLNTSGNLGIGTTSPTEPLTVQANSGGYALTLLGRSAGENAQWFAFANNAGTVQAGMYATSNNLIFATNSGYVERGRFDNSGNFLFNSGYGSVATAYGVRAWVNFNASSGTPTIRSSAGISSLTDNGTGDTTVNLSFTMPDINYSVSGICNWNITGNFGQFVNGPYNQAPTTSTFRILTPAYNGATYDCYQVTLQFVR